MAKIFVYGTLKTNLHNNYILKNEANGSSQFDGKGVTSKQYPLVVATKYGIPFMLDAEGKGHHVLGEIYDVDDKMLGKLDELEANGVLYVRTPIDVVASSDTTVQCETYLLKSFVNSLLDLPFLKEYKGQLKYIPPNKRNQSNVLEEVKGQVMAKQ